MTDRPYNCTTCALPMDDVGGWDGSGRCVSCVSVFGPESKAAATRLPPPAAVKVEAHSPIQPVDYAGAYAAVMSRCSEAHAYLSQGDKDRAYVLLTQAMAVRRRVEMRAVICAATPGMTGTP